MPYRETGDQNCENYLPTNLLTRLVIFPPFQRQCLAYQDLPVTLLGRLAVDSNYKGQRLGEFLLMDALRRSYETSSAIGSMAVIVDPIDESAVNFYRKFGCILLPNSGKMLLPMTIISMLFE